MPGCVATDGAGDQGKANEPGVPDPVDGVVIVDQESADSAPAEDHEVRAKDPREVAQPGAGAYRRLEERIQEPRCCAGHRQNCERQPVTSEHRPV